MQRNNLATLKLRRFLIFGTCYLFLLSASGCLIIGKNSESRDSEARDRVAKVESRLENLERMCGMPTPGQQDPATITQYAAQPVDPVQTTQPTTTYFEFESQLDSKDGVASSSRVANSRAGSRIGF
jgi:hypothetical protein